ncbi:Peroxisomal (S)-2-hydroxy-acid oxidase GLO1 [Colletotrichum gloeosporioides]|uniref:Peroxisomal (S)-2-hydroxy-acid oxidase GLO1 n=1 Tax=Colletotrichum gloeosporioides TaxID=474922 RepID=A0A8H4CVD9_COLGL|nr:Peroxisomal (S)-2-hydroxy-acid oxidase GLO1 [Colletotrichum gloeosporioides]KAF3810507.1 Peroxisomal (S)-2-hydroxy-acid oxidase GLO1 [Colletotrichum gloeosporioides]
MRSSLFIAAQFVAAAFAAEPWENEVDTGFVTYLDSTNYTKGSLPLLKDIRAIPDFDWAARQKLDNQKYSFYRTGTAGEFSYRHNLDVWQKVQLRSKHLSDVTKLNETLPVTILGYNFSAPIFIAPAARAAYGDEAAELNLVRAAGNENILYVPSMYASKSIEEIATGKSNNTLNGPQVIFQQIYTNGNLSVTWENIRRAERTGAKAIVWTIDAPGDSVRHRAARYDTTNANSVSSALTWDIYDQMKNQTNLPIILKGITTADEALLAVEKGAKAIYISNHGGRQLDHTPGPLEIAYEIYRNAPEVFQKVDVIADSGVRYGNDVLKLLALGVKAVGMGRPFMYANCYGLEGVTKAINIMKTEIVRDGAQMGATNLHNISMSFLNTRQLEQNVYLFDQQ